MLPLGVKQEFSRDATALLHYAAPPYVKTQAEADAYEGEIVMTNYERVRDGDINPKRFCAAALDEQRASQLWEQDSIRRFWTNSGVNTSWSARRRRLEPI
ncbi:MAG: hypothetical protein ACLUI3_03150 [Christensenellales bacterium]